MMKSSKPIYIIASVIAGVVFVAGLLSVIAPPPAHKPGAPIVAEKEQSAPPVVPEDVQGLPPKAQFGYVPHPQETERFIRSLPNANLREAAPWLFGSEADGKPVLLYKALYEVQPGWKVGKQGIGDCVSWGWKHGADICLAVEYKLGTTGDWKAAATESIYGGSRVEARGVKSGGWSDGSYGGAAAKWVSDWGILYRIPYPEADVDLTTYSSKRAKDWGNYGNGGQGDNGRLDRIAKEHPVKTVALVTTFDEAAKAIENGYPVPVCSGQGFTSTRDKDGFATASGSWSHCMVFIGVRYSPRPGLLCLNSWGPDWIRGPKWPDDQPDGSFWVEKSVSNSMLRGRDSFAVSNHVGFPRRKLEHEKGW